MPWPVADVLDLLSFSQSIDGHAGDTISCRGRSPTFSICSRFPRVLTGTRETRFHAVAGRRGS
jgi:hypothetical protein